MSEQAQAQVPVVETPTQPAPVDALASGGGTPSAAGNSAAAPLPDAEKPKIEVADGVSKHFAELEKRKAAFESERKAHAERMKAEEADRKAFDEFRKSRDEAKKDPVKAFGLLGMTPDDIAKALYEAPQQPSDVETLKHNFAELQAKLDKQEQERLTAEKARVDAENHKVATAHLSKFIEASKYDALKGIGQDGVAAVFQRMTAAYAQTQAVPDFDKVCAEVEAELDAWADRIAAVGKYQKKFSAKAEVVPAKADAKAPEEKKQAPAEKKVVLSNKTQADTPAGEQRPDDPSALRERAVRALKERLSAKAAALSTKKGAEQ
jgi:hypothetical protein